MGKAGLFILQALISMLTFAYGVELLAGKDFSERAFWGLSLFCLNMFSVYVIAWLIRRDKREEGETTK